VRSLSQLRTQAEEEISKTASSENDATRPFYHRAAALLAALRFYAQERGLDSRWVQEVVAGGNLDVMREVARALQQQGDAESVAAARSIDDVRVQGLRARRCVLATANITLWRLSNLDSRNSAGVAVRSDAKLTFGVAGSRSITVRHSR
jgi:chromosome condensin MukBEF complex kleisin-like MukF subunit